MAMGGGPVSDPTRIRRVGNTVDVLNVMTAVLAVLALVAASEHWGPARLAEAARELAAIVVPEFPVTGHDLAGLGIKPGPALGLELKRLERAWIDSGFALGKTDLLLLVKA